MTDKTTPSADDEQDKQQPQDSASELTPSAPATHTQPPVVQKGSSGIALFALLVAAAALTLSGWQWWTQPETVSDSTQGPDRAEIEQWIDSAVSASTGSQAEVSTAQAQALSGRIDTLESRMRSVSEQQNQTDQQPQRDLENSLNNLRAETRLIEEALGTIQQRQSQTDARLLRVSQTMNTATPAASDDRLTQIMLAETESLLHQAQLQLSVAGNSRQAATLMQLALDRLENDDEPMLTDLRTNLASLRDDVSEIETLDVNRVSSVIERLHTQVPALPLMMDRPSEPRPPEQEEAGYWDKLRDSMSDLVVVRTDLNAPHHLTSLEAQHLRDSLQLQLQVARLAAIRRDQALFNSSLASVTEQSRRYFDNESAQTGNFLQQLDELSHLELMPSMPDLTPLISETRRLASTLNQLGRNMPASSEASSSQEADS